MITVFLRKHFEVPVVFFFYSVACEPTVDTRPRPEGPRVTCAFKGTGSRLEEISSAPVATLLNRASLGYLPSFHLSSGLVQSVVLKGMYNPAAMH